MSSPPKYIGVKALKHDFKAVVEVGGVRTPLGHFATAEEAARAYDKAVVAHRGRTGQGLKGARLNFPEGVCACACAGMRVR